MPAYSGFWDGTGDFQPHALIINRSGTDKLLAKRLKRRTALTVKDALDTVTTSSNITSDIDYTRVAATAASVSQGDPVVNGGVRSIETVTLRTAGVLTAAEVTRVDEIAQHDSQPTYPTDASGNGDGGKGADVAPLLG